MLTTYDIANLLEVPQGTVQRWCREGRFRGAKFVEDLPGGKRMWLVPKEALIQFAPPVAGVARGTRRSSVRTAIQNLMADGHPRSMSVICEKIKCSHQLARVYLIELGFVRSRASGLWSAKSSTTESNPISSRLATVLSGLATTSTEDDSPASGEATSQRRYAW